MDAHHLRRLRHFLGLTQFDVSMATGINIGRISAFENERRDLDPVELRALQAYYAARMAMLNEGP